jgi:hypothetical protein
MSDPADVETELVNLNPDDTRLDDLRADRAAYAFATEVILGQVERARSNLGSGPPGRAD